MHETGKTLWLHSCGCFHEEIAIRFPELAPLLKWHLCTADGPLHYIENTIYLAGNKDHWGIEGKKERELHAARAAAIWPDATDEELVSPDLTIRLGSRLPALLSDFKLAIESLGFIY